MFYKVYILLSRIVLIIIRVVVIVSSWSEYGVNETKITFLCQRKKEHCCPYYYKSLLYINPYISLTLGEFNYSLFNKYQVLMKLIRDGQECKILSLNVKDGGYEIRYDEEIQLCPD